jgi:hypothetical protein
VECRQYPLPEELLNKPILLIGTTGADGVAALGDATAAGSTVGSILGWVTFSDCISYSSLESFNSDQARHCIMPGSTYAMRDGELEATVLFYLSFFSSNILLYEDSWAYILNVP